MKYTPLELMQKTVQILDKKKADEIVAIEVTNVTVIADYFVICSATSTTRIKTLSEEVEHKLKEEGIEPLRIEGYREGNWIVLDYGCMIVHIFHKEMRDFYDLERLWADGLKVDISALIENKED